MSASFILRRLSSLFFLFPLGFFLLFHGLINLRLLGPDGIQKFNESLTNYRSFPFLFLLEVIFLYIPLLIQATWVVHDAAHDRFSPFGFPGRYSLRYSAFRVCGLIAIVFIGFHLVSVRVRPSLVGVSADALWMVRLFETPWQVWFYLAGSTATLYYFAHGLWLFFVSWGLAVTPRAQERLYLFCLILFAVAAVMAWGVMAGLVYHYKPPPDFLGRLMQAIRTLFFR